MSGQVLGASSSVSGAAGVALLPNTGGTRVLFYTASVLFIGGLITLLLGVVTSRRGISEN